MKQIKLSGRERSVLRALDFSTGNAGEELLEHTRLESEDLVDVINGLMEAGFMEMSPYAERTCLESFREVHFEVNPSYALELRTAMART